MDSGKKMYRIGWIPDYPDFWNYTEETPEVKNLLGEGKKGNKFQRMWI